MKILVLAILLIGLGGTTVSAAPSVSITSVSGKVQISISLDRSNKFTEKIIDVLTKSPEVQEAINGYVTPGTVYIGPGFELNLMSQTSVQLKLMMNNSERFFVSGLEASFSGNNGVSSALRKAILASTSNHVTKQSTPRSRITSGRGEVAILEHDLFIGNFFHCVPGFGNDLDSHCSFKLVL